MFSQAQRMRNVMPSVGRAASKSSSWTNGDDREKRPLIRWIVPPFPIAFARLNEFQELRVEPAAHPGFGLSDRIVTNGHYPVFLERIQPAFPRRFGGEKNGSKAGRHIREPPRLLSMCILQCDERNLSAIPMEKRFRCW